MQKCKKKILKNSNFEDYEMAEFVLEKKVKPEIASIINQDSHKDHQTPIKYLILIQVRVFNNY